MTRKKTHDEFESELSKYDDLKPLTRAWVAEFLEMSVSTLDGWAKRSPPLPPPRVSLNGEPRYLAGDLKAFLRGLLNAPAPPDPAGLDDRPLRGGRRRKLPQPSFSAFLSRGAVDDEWPCMLMHGDDVTLPPRPVDFFQAPDLDLRDCDEARWLTLDAYGELLARYTLAMREMKPVRDALGHAPARRNPRSVV